MSGGCGSPHQYDPVAVVTAFLLPLFPSEFHMRAELGENDDLKLEKEKAKAAS